MSWEWVVIIFLILWVLRHRQEINLLKAELESLGMRQKNISNQENTTKQDLKTERCTLKQRIEKIERDLENAIQDIKKHKEIYLKNTTPKFYSGLLREKTEKLDQKLDEVVRYQDDDRLLLVCLNKRILRIEKKLYGKSLDSGLDEQTGAAKTIQREEETGRIQDDPYETIPTYKKTRARLFELDHL